MLDLLYENNFMSNLQNRQFSDFDFQRSDLDLDLLPYHKCLWVKIFKDHNPNRHTDGQTNTLTV